MADPHRLLAREATFRDNGTAALIPDLADDFLVMSGDVLTDLEFSTFLSEHTQRRRLFTISAAAREQRIDYGVLHVGRDGLLSAFQEKPITPISSA